jgi:hypothetical protein
MGCIVQFVTRFSPYYYRSMSDCTKFFFMMQPVDRKSLHMDAGFGLCARLRSHA